MRFSLRTTAIALLALPGLMLTVAQSGSAADDGKAKADPAKVEAYELDVCAVDGKKLGEHPVTFVSGGHEIKVCNADCEKEFNKDPKANLAKVEKLEHGAEHEGHHEPKQQKHEAK